MRGQPQASPARSQAAGRPRREARIPLGPRQARRQDIARPLPDPVAIRLCRIPDPAPPYDDEAPGKAGPGRADVLAAAIVGSLDEGGQPGTGAEVRPAEQPRAARASARPTRPAGTGERTVMARRTGTEGAARPAGPAGTSGRAVTTGRAGTASREPGTASREPGTWPSKFAQVLAETLAGSRPPAQIAPWTTERARSHIRRLGPLLAAGQRPLVQRVITSAPTAGVVEMSVVVGFGPRVRALAVRLERTEPRAATAGQAARQSRWLCTAVEAA
jgi:hypothetical protein